MNYRTADYCTLPTLAVARLVAGHLDLLWQSWQAGDGCCPVCCAPCAGLAELLPSGRLDHLYGVYIDSVGGESDLWDPVDKVVRRDWLDQAWARDPGCHTDPIPSPESESADLYRRARRLHDLMTVHNRALAELSPRRAAAFRLILDSSSVNQSELAELFGLTRARMSTILKED